MGYLIDLSVKACPQNPGVRRTGHASGPVRSFNALETNHQSPSNYDIVKSGWGNRVNFQHSYGLGMDPDGIAEGNAILDSFREADVYHSGSPGPTARYSSSPSISRSASRDYNASQRSAQSYIASTQHHQSYSYASRPVSTNTSHYAHSRSTNSAYHDSLQYHQASHSSAYSQNYRRNAQDSDSLARYFSALNVREPSQYENAGHLHGRYIVDDDDDDDSSAGAHSWTAATQSGADETHVAYSGFASATTDGSTDYNDSGASHSDPGDYHGSYADCVDGQDYDYSGSTEVNCDNGYPDDGDYGDDGYGDDDYDDDDDDDDNDDDDNDDDDNDDDDDY